MTVYHHAADILMYGESSFGPSDFDDIEQVVLAVKYSVKYRRLDGLKTALLMLEILYAMEYCRDPNYRHLIDNFIKYLYKHFSLPAVVAILSYGIIQKKIDLTRARQIGSTEVQKFHNDAKLVILNHRKNGWLQLNRRYAKYRSWLVKTHELIARQDRYVTDSLADPQTIAQIAMSLL